MAGFRAMSSVLSVVTLCAMAALEPVRAQRAVAQPSDDASKVSKVDAITIKQTTVAGYMKIGDIKGEATADSRAGAIEILAWSWGDGRAAGRSRPSSGPGTLTITKAVDARSPELADASRTRRRIGRMTVELRTADGSVAPILVTLEDVVISSIERSRAGDAPAETVSFVFQTIR